MKSRWSERDAQEFRDRYQEWGEDVALRVYSSRLIGGDPALVMHGGGNTSVKSTWRNLFGEPVEAIFVKGSGWDLDSIEPAGLPGLELAYLRRLQAVEDLSDEEMVNQLRTHLFDAAAPNPSVETLLHAFLPHKFVDHSHADVILALTNQAEGADLIAEALGPKVALVPYVMPGFALSGAAARVAEAHPGCEGMVLMHHGLFTWGETARESYERHLDQVTRAEDFLHARTGRRLSVGRPASAGEDRAEVAAEVAPLVRGALTRADDRDRRWILDFRVTGGIEELVDGEDTSTVLATGPLTPDHVIRTKELPLVLPPYDGTAAVAWAAELEERLRFYMSAYDRYFREASEARGRTDLERLDPLPRIVVIERLGVLAVGESKRAAAVAGDIYEHTAEVKAVARSLAPYRALDPLDLFDVEYWSLEQAKLGKKAAPALQGRVALVTGAGGVIGAAISVALAGEGAAVVATDIDSDALVATVDRARAENTAGEVTSLVCDVCDEASVAAAFRQTRLSLGGVDIVVLNAGIAKSAPIDELSLDDWNRVLEINLTGYFITLREAARLFKVQGTGGNVVVNASKNVFAPGADFAAYSVSKGGGHQLGRLAAIELAPHGVRVNMINPDAVFSYGDLTSGLWKEVGRERARSRGLDLEQLEDYYRDRNLLKMRITAEDVARAVLFFAREETPTTGATLPVDGGLPGAFPR